MNAFAFFGIAIGALGVTMCLLNANYSGALWAFAYTTSQITILNLSRTSTE